MRWLFWNVDLSTLDLELHAHDVIARVLEHGRMPEVRWVLERYGTRRVHRFFKTVAHPELSERTVMFWRAFFKAQGERWPSAPDWRRNSSAPWIA